MLIKKKLSLRNRVIIITRAITQQGESRKLFEDLGAKVLDLPSLIIGPPSEWGPLDQALGELDDFNWLILSSSNGVEAVEKRLRLMQSSLAHLPEGLKVAVVGKKTANSLKNFGGKADFIPPDFVSDSLIKNFPVSPLGLRLLIPRVQSGGRTVLADSFSESGAHIVEVAAYESSCPTSIPKLTLDALNNNEVDAITFTSSKTVSHTYQLLKENLGDNWKQKIDLIKLISIGPQTSLSCNKYFKRLDKEADPHDINGLIRACLISIQENNI